MKKLLMLVAIGVTSLTFGTAVKAAGLSIELGDRPYYNHGPRYWDRENEMIWVPGHWSAHRQHWIHGHYIRGEHHRRWNNNYRVRGDGRYDDGVRADIRLDDRR